MDGDELAEGIAIADAGAGGFAGVFQVLAAGSDRGERVEDVVGADCDRSLDHHVGVQPGPVSDSHLVADDAVGSDFDPGSQLGLGGNDGGGMNHDGEFSRGAYSL